MSFLTSQAVGERAVLKAFALQQFDQIRSTVHGLSDEQMHLAASASVFSPALMLQHITEVADSWGAALAAAPARPDRDDPSGGTFDVPAGTTRADLLADFDAAVTRFGQILEEVDLDTDVPVPPAPWYPPELTSWQARWVVQHMITEVARHAGHADIVRESIDGKGSYELNARVDGELADDEEWPSW